MKNLKISSTVFDLIAMFFSLVFGYTMITQNYNPYYEVTLGCLLVISIQSTIRFTISGFINKLQRVFVYVGTLLGLIGICYALYLVDTSPKRIMYIMLSISVYTSLITLDKTIRYMKKVVEKDDSEEHF